MKVDMDGKNCNLPSEHTPLGQTNTEKAANYKICEYLGRIPGIHPETISFLSNFQKNTVKLKKTIQSGHFGLHYVTMKLQCRISNCFLAKHLLIQEQSIFIYLKN